MPKLPPRKNPEKRALTHAEILSRSRGFLEHSQARYRAESLMHGENHPASLDALHDMLSKGVDHAEATWKYLAHQARTSKDPEILGKMRQAEKEFDIFTAQMGELEKRHKKNKQD